MANTVQDQFRIGAVISRSLAVLANNAVPFGVLYLIINAPSSIYAFTLAGTPGADEDTGVKLLSFAEAFLGLAAGAAATYATVQELRGRRVGLSELIGRGLAQGGAAIRVALLSGIFLILAFIALIVPGLVFYTMWWVAIPVAVIERPGAMASLRRSAELTRGHRWRVFGLIVCLFAALIAVLVLCVMALFAVFFVFQHVDQAFVDRIAAVATWLLSAVLMAVQAVLTAVSYYYLRVAKEGIGIDDIAGVFD